MENLLWTDKYKPENLSEVIGQKKVLEEVLKWIDSWKKGKALLFYGHPGVGKSLVVETLSKERGYALLQLNASDERNAKNIETFRQTTKTSALFHKGKIILIDEVDGISGRDKGAVGSIVDMIKNSDFPVFLVANDPWAAKLRPLRSYVKMIKFHKIPTPSIAKRLRDICEKEGVEAKDDVLKNLARWSQGDMRSAMNDLQMLCQGKKEISERDLEVLGYRERESSVFDIMPSIFRSGNIKVVRNLIKSADKDPDEIFLWIGTNIQYEFKDPEEIARAYEIVSKADMFRKLVLKQQKRSFKGFMIDMMSGVSLARKGGVHGWVPYQPPQRIMMLGRTKVKRALVDSVCEKIGGVTHCSKRTVKKDYLPYLRIIMKKNKCLNERLGLGPEEIEAVKINF